MTNNEIVLTPEMVETLLGTDDAFKYKLGIVKENIIDNLKEYSSSIKDIDIGLFTDRELNTLDDSKVGVMDALARFQEQLNVNITTASSLLDFSDFSGVMPKENQEESLINNKEERDKTFATDVPKIIIDKFGDDGIKQLQSLFEGLNGALTISGDGDGDGAKSGDKGGIMKSILNMALKKMGIVLPPGILPLLSGLGAAAPWIGLAAGIVWMAIDGVRGYIAAEKWGVGKFAGVMGSLLGGMDSGFMGAFKNFGKWALIGVAIGIAGGPPGMILGGILGAVIGALLGWIGGEKIAKGFNDTGKWFAEQWNIIMDWHTQNWMNMFETWNNITSAVSDWWGGVVDGFNTMLDNIVNWGIGVKDSVVAFGGMIKDKFNSIVLSITEWFDSVVWSIQNWFDGIYDLWSNIIRDIGNSVKDIGGNIANWWNGIIGWYREVFNTIIEWFKVVKSKLTSVWNKITKGIYGVIENMADWFVSIRTKIQDKFTAIKDYFMKSIMKLDPRNWGKSESEIERMYKAKGLGTDTYKTRESIVGRSSTPPEVNANAPSLAMQKSEKIMGDSLELQKRQHMELMKLTAKGVGGTEKSNTLLADIKNKPTGDDKEKEKPQTATAQQQEIQIYRTAIDSIYGTGG